MLSTNTNIKAMNIGRVISRNKLETNRKIDSLSSGLRITRAGRDAAGLSISEGMRAQVAALAQNVRNTEHAGDLLQVAQGALSIVSDALVQMRGLAVRSSNSDLNDEQRRAISIEFNQLRASVDRLAQTTTYNTQILLAGFDTVVDDLSTALSDDLATGVDAVDLIGAQPGTYTFSDTAGEPELTLGNGVVTQTVRIATQLDGDKVADGTKVRINFDRIGVQVTLRGAGAGDVGDYVTGDLDGKNIVIGESTGGDFQVGPNDRDHDRLALSLPDLRATSNSLNLDKVSVKTIKTSRTAINPIDKAITRIAAERGKIGAMQNRMASTINFSENEIENTISAESTIRDADVAFETSRFTRSRILGSTSEAMLAQAFTNARLALQLL